MSKTNFVYTQLYRHGVIEGYYAIFVVPNHGDATPRLLIHPELGESTAEQHAKVFAESLGYEYIGWK